MEVSGTTRPNELFTIERKKRNLTQEDVAEQLSGILGKEPNELIASKTVARWEQGAPIPSSRYRRALEQLFGISIQQLGWPKEGEEIPFWGVPYPRNPYFTGREDVLEGLHDLLVSPKSDEPKPIALIGLGGIGKTQIAIEYAYRYTKDYHTVGWIGADSPEALTLNFASLASLLNLSLEDDHDQDSIIAEVQQWLKKLTRWLLIFDNVNDLRIVHEILPSQYGGHIILTTQQSSTGTIARSVKVSNFSLEVGSRFLLKRAKLEAFHEAENKPAVVIVQALDGLPLALDQVGAYTEETGSSLSRYLDLYQIQREKLLATRGDVTKKRDHPESVATTLSLSIEKVVQVSLAATELLRLLAFFHPELIPEEIITQGAFLLSPALQLVAVDPLNLDETIKDLFKYSLIGRDRGTKTLSIHRLVQAVLVDKMAEDEQHLWAECAVRAVNHVFPDVDFQTRLDDCRRYFLHAQGCAALITQREMVFPEAARLLEQTGLYLFFLAQYAEAEPLLLRALAIREQRLGPEHLDTASSLNSLAMLREVQDKYPAEAEVLYKRALAIRKRLLGLDHSDTAGSLDNLADLYRNQGRYVEAEPLFLHALAIREQLPKPDHFGIAGTCNNLALLYHKQGRYVEAESLFRRALMIFKQVLGPDHSTVATSLNNLAMVCRALEKYEEAKTLYQQALIIREKVFGIDHPRVATVLGNLAMVHFDLGEYAEAEKLLLNALTIDSKRLGMESREVAYDLNNLGRVFVGQGRYGEAELRFQHALLIRQQQQGPEHPETADTLDNLADLFHKQGRYAEAVPLFQRALLIRQQRLGPRHLRTLKTMKNYELLLEAMKREVEGETEEEKENR